MAKSKEPPISGRFRKGQSGNPKGRPPSLKETPTSAFAILFDKTLTVTKDGVPREVSVEEALQHRTYQDAIAGKRLAQREILKMIAIREYIRSARRELNPPVITSLLEPNDPTNADVALKLLGIATHDEGRDGWQAEREPLLLEVWAVQAALSRRRGGETLSDRKIKEVKRCTRDAAKLRWPRGYRT